MVLVSENDPCVDSKKIIIPIVVIDGQRSLVKSYIDNRIDVVVEID